MTARILQHAAPPQALESRLRSFRQALRASSASVCRFETGKVQIVVAQAGTQLGNMCFRHSNRERTHRASRARDSSDNLLELDAIFADSANAVGHLPFDSGTPAAQTQTH